MAMAKATPHVLSCGGNVLHVLALFVLVTLVHALPRHIEGFVPVDTCTRRSDVGEQRSELRLYG